MKNIKKGGEGDTEKGEEGNKVKRALRRRREVERERKEKEN